MAQKSTLIFHYCVSAANLNQNAIKQLHDFSTRPVMQETTIFLEICMQSSGRTTLVLVNVLLE